MCVRLCMCVYQSYCHSICLSAGLMIASLSVMSLSCPVSLSAGLSLIVSLANLSHWVLFVSSHNPFTQPCIYLANTSHLGGERVKHITLAALATFLFISHLCKGRLAEFGINYQKLFTAGLFRFSRRTNDRRIIGMFYVKP